MPVSFALRSHYYENNNDVVRGWIPPDKDAEVTLDSDSARWWLLVNIDRRGDSSTQLMNMHRWLLVDIHRRGGSSTQLMNMHRCWST